jgi:hypothetical protein
MPHWLHINYFLAVNQHFSVFSLNTLFLLLAWESAQYKWFQRLFIETVWIRWDSFIFMANDIKIGLSQFVELMALKVLNKMSIYLIHLLLAMAFTILFDRRSFPKNFPYIEQNICFIWFWFLEDAFMWKNLFSYFSFEI